MKNKLTLLSLGLSIAITTSFAAETTSPEPCVTLKQQLQKIVPSVFVFSATKEKNVICSFITQDTGVVFEKDNNSFATWSQILRSTLQKQGWRQTKATLDYAADGPFATQFALEKKPFLAIVNLRVNGDTKTCPNDQPMDLYTNCGLSPKNRNYQISVALRKSK